MLNPRSLSRTRTAPIQVRRSRRFHDINVLTSLPTGRMVPIAAARLHREDAANGTMRIGFEMEETVELLMNAVNVNVKAYLVPDLAKPRFLSMDDLNRAYEGVPREVGDPVIKYIETAAAGAHGSNPILKYLGKHARNGQQINQDYVESYNLIWNFRAKNRSPKITQRARLANTLAPAFWQHERFAHIVPDFDAASMEGRVNLQIVNPNLVVKSSGADIQVKGADGASRALRVNSGTNTVTVTGSAPGATTNLKLSDASTGILAELSQDGIQVALSDLEMARKTQAFAKLREQYVGLSDDYLIDLLMDGITIPEQAWRQPILLAERSTVFGMSKRYSSSSDDLTASVVNGATFIDLTIMCPRVPMGGTIMVVAEITPDQLFERQRDPWLHAQNVDALPSFLRDELDPQKVSIVKNEVVDLDHATPNDTFGYAPLNWEWNHAGPCIGGKFFRPAVDAAFDEDRQRLWAVETANPVLSEDFYLCKTMHNKPFVVTNQDPFEAMARGQLAITGNTVFGSALLEATDSYDTIMDSAPQDRIDPA